MEKNRKVHFQKFEPYHFTVILSYQPAKLVEKWKIVEKIFWIFFSKIFKSFIMTSQYFFKKIRFSIEHISLIPYMSHLSKSIKKWWHNVRKAISKKRKSLAPSLLSINYSILDKIQMYFTQQLENRSSILKLKLDLKTFWSWRQE